MDIFVRRGLTLFFVVGAIYVSFSLLGQLLPILMPFFAALIVAYLFNPLVESLTRRVHIPRWAAIGLVFLSIAASIVVTLWFVVPLIWEQILYAHSNIPNVIQWINQNLRPWLHKNLHIETNRINLNVMADWLTKYLQENYSLDGTQQMLARIAQSSLNVISVMSLVVLVPIVSFYFLLDWREMLARFHQLIPRRAEPKTMQILHECDEVLGAFVRGQLLVMVLLGIVYAVGLQLVGISVGLIIGIVAGFLSIIPYMGFTVGLVSALVACLFQYGFALPNLALVMLVFMVGQVIEGYILQPFLLGDRIGLPPVAVIFAVLAGAQLGGIIGMLLALPVAAMLVVLLRHAHDFYKTSDFYRTTNTNTVAETLTLDAGVGYDLRPQNADQEVELELAQYQDTPQKPMQKNNE
ncbi:MAG: AI-2E family transporter [Aquirhabdus sp.]